jgi:hypothetical protein
MKLDKYLKLILCDKLGGREMLLIHWNVIVRGLDLFRWHFVKQSTVFHKILWTTRKVTLPYMCSLLSGPRSQHMLELHLQVQKANIAGLWTA